MSWVESPGGNGLAEEESGTADSSVGIPGRACGVTSARHKSPPTNLFEDDRSDGALAAIRTSFGAGSELFPREPS